MWRGSNIAFQTGSLCGRQVTLRTDDYVAGQSYGVQRVTMLQASDMAFPTGSRCGGAVTWHPNRRTMWRGSDMAFPTGSLCGWAEIWCTEAHYVAGQ